MAQHHVKTKPNKGKTIITFPTDTQEKQEATTTQYAQH